jgi:hypothetical protein
MIVYLEEVFISILDNMSPVVPGTLGNDYPNNQAYIYGVKNMIIYPATESDVVTHMVIIFYLINMFHTMRIDLKRMKIEEIRQQDARIINLKKNK